jgi:hypothetical protein
VLMTRAITSITAKVTRYSVSATAKEKYRGTKKKSNAATLSTEARIEGPRPSRVATSTTPRRYTITRVEGWTNGNNAHARAVAMATIRVALPEKLLDGAVRLRGHIDLALAEPLNQLVRRKVDELHLVGGLEHGVRDGLSNRDAGDASHHVIQAFEVLDIDRRIDVDTRVSELHDVLPASLVARAGRVRVSELVDENEGRTPGEGGVEIELTEHGATVLDDSWRQPLEPFEKRLGLRPPVGLDIPHDDIETRRTAAASGLEHGVCLPHARGGAEEDLQLPAAAASLLRLHSGEEGIRIRPMLAHRTLRGGFRASPPAVSLPPSGFRPDRDDRRSWRGTRHPIEREIECKHVHAGFPQYPELPALDVGFAELPDTSLVEPARLGDPTHLVESRRRGDVRVEPAPRRGHEVDGHRRRVAGIGRAQGVDPRSRRGVEDGIAGSQVGAGRGARVVSERGRGREPPPEESRIVEQLADEGGAHRLAAPLDQAPVGLRGKEDLGDPGHDEG